MPSLRQYRDRIASVKSTRKITSAMKMVAASKLKRAQEHAQASQPYAVAMAEMLNRVAANVTGTNGPKLLVGTGADKKHLLVVMTSDRGLAGGFNSNLIRFARVQANKLMAEGKQVKIVTIGRKARDVMKRDMSENIIENIVGLGGKKRLNLNDVQTVSDIIMREFAAENFDVCTLIYNQFVNVMVQKPTSQQLIPFSVAAPAVANSNSKETPIDTKGHISPYSFEPSEEEILEQLLPKNISIQIFRALLDSSAGEHAARMTAMDAATRNAGDMIKRLSLEYNRARQAAITKELIEIISGAEAV